jgi:hypothetical protein
MDTGLEFRILGPVEVVRNGQLIGLGGRRQRALLALMLLEPGRPVATDRLIDELWRGDTPTGASTVPSYVSRLRKALGDQALIVGESSGYALAVNDDQIDSARFERLVSEGAVALSHGRAQRADERLAAALALWRGRRSVTSAATVPCMSKPSDWRRSADLPSKRGSTPGLRWAPPPNSWMSWKASSRNIPIASDSGAS